MYMIITNAEYIFGLVTVGAKFLLSVCMAAGFSSATHGIRERFKSATFYITVYIEYGETFRRKTFKITRSLQSKHTIKMASVISFLVVVVFQTYPPLSLFLKRRFVWPHFEHHLLMKNFNSLAFEFSLSLPSLAFDECISRICHSSHLAHLVHRATICY